MSPHIEMPFWLARLLSISNIKQDKKIEQRRDGAVRVPPKGRVAPIRFGCGSQGTVPVVLGFRLEHKGLFCVPVAF